MGRRPTVGALEAPANPRLHVWRVNMALTIRAGTLADAEACGRVFYAGFQAIASRHGFPPDVADPEMAIERMRALLSHRGFFSVVAEVDGRVVGSNFLDERSTIAGVGPITVDPVAQNQGIGRRLMEAVLERARDRRFPGVRLLQTSYHARSLALYASLGFGVREPIACMQGPAVAVSVPGLKVRKAIEADCSSGASTTA